MVVTGPRRSMFRTTKDLHPSVFRLQPYFPAPFGDMMITGCFGLLSAVADVLPGLADPIRASLSQANDRGIAPWDVAS